MDGRVRSPRQKYLRALAVSTSSYNVLLKVMGPMELRAVNRIIKQAMFDLWGYGVTVG